MKPHFGRMALFAGFSLVLVHVTAAGGTPVPPATQQAACRIVRVAAGPQGADVAGEFRLQEERTTFSRAHDTQVTVYFKWEAAPAVHHLAATWRSPGGTSSATNAFDYTAKDRLFGAYWTIPVSGATPTGKWTIDATVDGIPCGSLSFDVVDADARPAAAARRPLAPKDLYERLQSAFAELERGTTGRLGAEPAAAFFIQPGILATAFTAIDATETVHVTIGRSERREVTSVLAWDRRQDWALLPVASPAMPLPLATAPPATGDRCYSIEARPGGTRLLAEATIIGAADSPASGSRWVLSFTTGEGVPGAPVINEFGEVVGIISGGLTPGRTTLRERLRARAEMRGAPVVPVSLVNLPSAPSPVTIDSLRNRGIIMSPVVAEDSIFEGGFARDIQKGAPQAVDQRELFTAADKRFFVFVKWEPKQRIRGMAKLAVYDADNRALLESKPAKADFKTGSMAFSQWQIPVPPRAGTYRVDVMVDAATMWRGFVTIK